MKGYQLKILISDSKPPVWRRINIPQAITFELLHETIQELFGWQDMHLHKFVMKYCGVFILNEMEDDYYIHNFKQESYDHALSDYFVVGEKLTYVYDFGDYWEHVISIEKEIEMEENYPVLVKWKGDNFAEDAGGVFGYYAKLAIANNPNHREHKKMLNWLEMQHIDFIPECVEAGLEDNYLIIKHITPVVSKQINKDLNLIISQLKPYLMKINKDSDVFLAIQQGEDNRLMNVMTYNNETSIYFFEKPEDFVHGFVNLNQETNHNSELFVNGFQLCFHSSKESFPYDWINNHHDCTITKFRIGYLPDGINDNEALLIIDMLTYFLQVCKERLTTLPSSEIPKVLSISVNKDKEISNLKEIENLNFKFFNRSPKNDATTKKIKKTSKTYYIDLFAIFDYDSKETNGLSVYITIESLRGNYSSALLKPNDYVTYDELANYVYHYLYLYFVNHGAPKKIFYNHDNIKSMIQELCDFFQIQLVYKEFITNSENDRNAEVNEVMDEELLNENFLNALANLSDEELDEIMQKALQDNLNMPQHYLS
ncbi:MAG: plasmid pRiA4b ORF-3 family protein [Longicatena sp.]